jgi:hypothetical protein
MMAENYLRCYNLFQDYNSSSSAIKLYSRLDDFLKAKFYTTSMESVTESQQPPLELHKQRIPILLIILIFILTGIASYFGYQNWQLRNNTNKLTTSAEPTPNEQRWSVDTQISQSIQEITNQLLSNTLLYTSTESGIPTFTKEFDLSQINGWANYVITVYKYSPGAKLKEGYEGLSWTRNLDTEVKELNKVSSFKNGIYINKAISAESGQTYTNVIVKNIGNQKYAITDSYFPPSRSWHRKYQAYDQKTNNIIEVTMGISPKMTTIQQKNICFEDKCALFFFYPEEINNFFLEQEGLMDE